MPWVNILDSVIEVGKAIRALDFRNLRDNLAAMAAGEAGAPRIQAAALNFSGAEVAWVAGLMAYVATGGVGTYAFLTHTTAGTTVVEGGTYAGSSLRYSGFASNTSGDFQPSLSTGGVPAGTWRCMGRAGATSRQAFTLFLRIS